MRAPCLSNVDLLQIDHMSFLASGASFLWVAEWPGGRRSRERFRAILNRTSDLFLKDTSNDARVRFPGFSPCLLSVFSVLQSSLRCSRCFSSNTAVVPCLQKPLHKFSNSFSIWNPQTRVKRVFKYSLVFSR